MNIYVFSNKFLNKLTAGTMILALVFSQTAPALAYGPGNAFGGYNDVRAMGYFRIPLSASQADKDRTPSFGFMVQRQFQFNDPLYETMPGSYRNSTRPTVYMMDLRFGMDGKLSGFDVGGFNAFQAKTFLNAAEDEDEEETPVGDGRLIYAILATLAAGGMSAMLGGGGGDNDERPALPPCGEIVIKPGFCA